MNIETARRLLTRLRQESIHPELAYHRMLYQTGRRRSMTLEEVRAKIREVLEQTTKEGQAISGT